MSQQRAGAAVVTDREGLRGTIDTSSAPPRGDGGQVLVRLEDGRQALVPVGELLPQPDGGFRLPFSFGELTREHEARAAGAGARQPGTRGGDETETVVVPVVAERLEVQKRTVESGGVRIRKIVREREEIVDEPLLREEVRVKRVPVDRVVDGPVPVRHVGNTMIVSLLEEVLVVEKRLVLKEELHITKEQVETYKPQRVLLRSEEATVERVEGPEPQNRGDDDALPAPSPGS